MSTMKPAAKPMENPNPAAGKADPKLAKKDRLAAALRRNLLRRKMAAATDE